MTPELDAFRAADFDWTRQLKSIWRDPTYHVPSLHEKVVDDVVDYFRTKTRDPDPANEPLGRVIVGPAGYGKTHLIGELRRRVWESGGWFVLLDFIGIKDFWASVALGFLNSLQVRVSDHETQYDQIVLKLGAYLGIRRELSAIAERLIAEPEKMIVKMAQLFVAALARRHRDEAFQHQDVVTALILLVSDDIDCHSAAHGWLQGLNLAPEDARPLGFKGENSAIKVVQGLSWIMSLVGPTLIAIDQIDAIVTASNALARASDGGGKQEQEEAQFIVDSLAEGLMDLHEKKRRAVTVVSCLEATWKVLQDRTQVAVTARYYAPANLRALPNGAVTKALVSARLSQAYEPSGFTPPYETWPFSDTAFESAVGFSPRQLLRLCEDHRQFCVAAGAVTELLSFDKSGNGEPPSQSDQTASLDPDYADALRAAAVSGLLEADGEDKLRDLLDGTLRLLEKHLDLPNDVDAVVQRDPDQKRPSLHGRLSFTFRAEGDREQHFCFRILGHSHATAFQSRLKAAMTASGIDTALKFRHLFILRRGEAPSGPKTAELVRQFLKAGGKFIAPTDDDLRMFVALAEMDKRQLPGFDAWLRARRPLFDSPLFKAAGLCPPPFLAAPPEPPRPQEEAKATTTQKEVATPPPTKKPNGPPLEQTTKPPAADPSPVEAPPGQPPAGAPKQAEALPVPPPPTPPATPQPLSAGRVIPIGRRYAHGALGEPVALSANHLSSHVAVLAGSGSGKTVLLRRIIEEAALLGIPSIVLDPNNDLSRLGDAWPARPESFSDDDTAKAEAYRARADVVIWTPGVAGGRPISLNLLPDFAAIDDADERVQAIEMACATLAPYSGKGARAFLKQGVLADALRAFAKAGGGTLDDLINLLSELPEGVSKISNSEKLGADIADQLRAAIATNPLLQSQGEPLDPETLFEGPAGKTRISVINLAGLATADARDSFVNRLQMSLFTFIKRRPSATGRLYVLDEAQNFAPSGVGTACKASALSLVAQARKYGLGMLFATQTPKGIDNKIVSNCSTQVYGKMNAPATIEAIRELAAAKGGSADDIGKLVKGEFYFSTEGSLRPLKVRTPLCLSWHPANPPTADEVIQKARFKAG